MKYFLCIILLLPFSASYCYAQRLYDKPEVQTGETTYKVEVFEGRFPMIGVTNAKNSLAGTRMIVSSDVLGGTHFTQPASLLNSFWSTFNEEDLKELLPEKIILAMFYVNPYGRVREISFLLKKDTRLSPEKLAELEAALKKNVSFSFNIHPQQAERANYFVITVPISTAKVLNKTLEPEF
ncbi:hypothetical protein DXT99_12090 [Pontibacter diazotrophicus]|uniref:Uncharacterized protein n=1 Tax=Pontibacter diazotrophicus TaxID=1400979 RepID=A0A3D8LC91_9BACT|nr:hypothetical protein [Pontibacter diazotrophicus]RDV15015.1 hypothetical protein DXT99_12090 [Pontibacter diazotrophicus]